MTLLFVYAMVAISLLILTGWAGHISLGQFALVGFGAATTSVLYGKHGWDITLAILAGTVVSALVALVIGLPALRIKGPFLAVTTLAFAVALDSYFLNPVHFRNWIPQNVDRPVLWRRFPLESERAIYYVCLAFLVLAILVALGVRRSRGGRALLATRDNTRASGAMAVPTTASKLSACSRTLRRRPSRRILPASGSAFVVSTPRCPMPCSIRSSTTCSRCRWSKRRCYSLTKYLRTT